MEGGWHAYLTEDACYAHKDAARAEAARVGHRGTAQVAFDGADRGVCTGLGEGGVGGESVRAESGAGDEDGGEDGAEVHGLGGSGHERGQWGSGGCSRRAREGGMPAT